MYISQQLLNQISNGVQLDIGWYINYKLIAIFGWYQMFQLLKYKKKLTKPTFFNLYYTFIFSNNITLYWNSVFSIVKLNGTYFILVVSIILESEGY